MQLLTTPDVPGKKIKQSLGLVRGSTIRTKHIGRDVMAGLKTLVGGELKGYTEMLNEAREQALKRMVTQARKLKADAIVNVRFTTSQVAPNAAEILVYGTAVKV